MHRKLVLAFVVAGAVTVVPAGAALAHPGHESCKGGAVGVAAQLGVIPGPGPEFGPFVKTLATAGMADETVLLIHEVYCEEHAPGE